jgi:hypothetical protein
MNTATLQTRRFNETSERYEDVDVPVVVGDGMTYHIGCDGYPLTVRKVSASGKTLWLSRDRFRGNGQSSYADFEKTGVFIPQDVPESEWEKYTKRADGSFRPCRSKCGYLSVGRSYKQDPHF